MPISKDVLELMNETTLAAGATDPTSPGGVECSIVELTEVSQLSLELEAVFNADATAPCIFHVRASTTGGTEPAEWDTQD